MRGSRIHLIICATAVLLGAGIRPAAAIDTHRADVKSFIKEVSGRDSISKRQLRKLLNGAKSQPAIIDAMNRPAEKAKPWYEYRPIFLTEKRIQEGADFWIAHRQELDRASVKTGVAPEYLAAIVGVETFYGRLTGSYRVLDALATLAFDYPARAKFFRDELEQFILLSRERGLDPKVVKGSYAGAMGAPQFMPHYAQPCPAPNRGGVRNWADYRNTSAGI
jgi:membrane-bound lytic murein transglycosylase B